MKVKNTLSDSSLSVNSLDNTDSEKEKTKITNLLNVLYDHYTNTTPYELTITFDDKKLKNIWHTDIYHDDDIYIAVRMIMHEHDNNFKWFIMREWGNNGMGRIHFHGIINQIKGGQTAMAKLQASLKRYFGRDCRINNMYNTKSYIMYITKRLYQEKHLLPEEWVSSELLHTWLNIFYEEINAPEITWDTIETWHMTPRNKLSFKDI